MEVDSLCKTIFKDNQTISFEEFKKGCEEVTSEMFLMPYILLKNKLPGYEQFVKFNPSIKGEFSPKIKLASPRVLSNYSPMCTKSTFSPPSGGGFSSFALANNGDKKKTEEPKSENPEITKAINSLNVGKFQRAKKIEKGSSSDKQSDQAQGDGNIYICICGKILVNSKLTLCENCSVNSAKSKMCGELFLLDVKYNTLVSNWAQLEDRDLFLYEKKDSASKPTAVVSLVDYYISSHGSISLAYKGKDYCGFQLQSSKSNIIYYTMSPKDKENWVNAINSIIKCANINEYYEMKGLLGKGKFGVVREAIHKQSGVHVAVKGLVKSKMKLEDLEMIRREVEILKICNHPGVIKLFDFFENDQYVFIVIELLNGSDLVNYFSKRDFNMPEPLIANIATQMLKAVEYIHSIGVIHRDLKGENILMSDSTEKAILKLTDFGLSKIVGPNEKCTEAYGTLGYAAPELYLQKPYDKAVDIWGIGVVIFTLLSKGQMPFDGSNDKDIIWKTVCEEIKFNGPEWKDVSEDGKNFIKRMLEKNPQERMTIPEAWKHKWIQNFNK